MGVWHTIHKNQNKIVFTMRDISGIIPLYVIVSIDRESKLFSYIFQKYNIEPNHE